MPPVLSDRRERSLVVLDILFPEAMDYTTALKHQYSIHSVNGGGRDPPLFTRGILTVLKNHKAISHATRSVLR